MNVQLDVMTKVTPCSMLHCSMCPYRAPRSECRRLLLFLSALLLQPYCALTCLYCTGHGAVRLRERQRQGPTECFHGAGIVTWPATASVSSTEFSSCMLLIFIT